MLPKSVRHINKATKCCSQLTVMLGGEFRNEQEASVWLPARWILLIIKSFLLYNNCTLTSQSWAGVDRWLMLNSHLPPHKSSVPSQAAHSVTFTNPLPPQITNAETSSMHHCCVIQVTLFYPHEKQVANCVCRVLAEARTAPHDIMFWQLQMYPKSCYGKMCTQHAHVLGYVLCFY